MGDWKWFMCFLSNNHSFITYWKLKTALQVSLFQGRYFCLHRGCVYCILDYSCYSGGTIRALPHFELEFSANHPKFVIMKTLPYCFATWNVPFFLVSSLLSQVPCPDHQVKAVFLSCCPF